MNEQEELLSQNTGIPCMFCKVPCDQIDNQYICVYCDITTRFGGASWQTLADYPIQAEWYSNQTIIIGQFGDQDIILNGYITPDKLQNVLNNKVFL